MALITCPSCGKQISPNASTCPGCGEPVKRKPRNRSLAIVFYFLATLCFVGGMVAIAILNAKEKIHDRGAIICLIICVCVTFLLAVLGRICGKPAKV